MEHNVCDTRLIRRECHCRMHHIVTPERFHSQTANAHRLSVLAARDQHDLRALPSQCAAIVSTHSTSAHYGDLHRKSSFNSKSFSSKPDATIMHKLRRSTMQIESRHVIRNQSI